MNFVGCNLGMVTPKVLVEGNLYLKFIYHFKFKLVFNWYFLFTIFHCKLHQLWIREEVYVFYKIVFNYLNVSFILEIVIVKHYNPCYLWDPKGKYIVCLDSSYKKCVLLKYFPLPFLFYLCVCVGFFKMDCFYF